MSTDPLAEYGPATSPICKMRGHCNWKSMGGANCGCPDGHCSVPVHVCQDCSECDYGENDEADRIRQACNERGE
jgi:hypothetical protein